MYTSSSNYFISLYNVDMQSKKITGKEVGYSENLGSIDSIYYLSWGTKSLIVLRTIP